MYKEIIKHLQEDPIRNCNMINFIEENEIMEVVRIEDAVLVKGISDRLWIYFSCTTEDELYDLLKHVNDDENNFAVVEDWMLEVFDKQFKYEKEITTLKLYLPENIPSPVYNPDIKPLRITDAEFVHDDSDYREFIPIEYVRDRITKGISGAYFVDNNPIAWAITHDDGAIGFLHVLNQYRGKGYGKEVTAYMINKVRERNKLPFAHVEESNNISLSLVNKLGFVVDRRICWIRRT